MSGVKGNIPNTDDGNDFHQDESKMGILYPNAEKTIDEELMPRIVKDENHLNFILLSGFPGAGKSSFILPLLTRKLGIENLFIISGDRGTSGENIVYGMGDFNTFADSVEKYNAETEETSDTYLKDALDNKKIILIDKPFLTIKEEETDTEIQSWIKAIKTAFCYEDVICNIFVIYLNITCQKAYDNAKERSKKDSTKGRIGSKGYKMYHDNARNIFFSPDSKNFLETEGIHYIQLNYSDEHFDTNCVIIKEDTLEKDNIGEGKIGEGKIGEGKIGGKRKQTRRNKKTRKKTRKKTTKKSRKKKYKRR